MKKRIILSTLLALVTLTGWAQEKPDTITINFQLASKTKGEMVGVLYPDHLFGDFSAPACYRRQWAVDGEDSRLSHASYSGLESE